MPRGQHREEATLSLLAALLLVVGVLVYAFDRGGAAYFLTGWASGHGRAALFGPVGNHLATFVHSLAVILVTAAVLRPWSYLLPAIVIGWLTVECLFDVGQISPLDVLSIGLGAAAAYWVARTIERGDSR